jgi:hypothetical protein
MWGALLPLTVAVIRDACNPRGLLRSFGRKLLGRARSGGADGAIEARYTVLGEKKPQSARKGV